MKDMKEETRKVNKKKSEFKDFPSIIIIHEDENEDAEADDGHARINAKKIHVPTQKER